MALGSARRSEPPLGFHHWLCCAPGRASGQWWPAELGFPNGTGAQNQVRYAYFNQKRRLAVELNGHVTVYDTLDHQISGVSQQQGRGGSLTLTSQHGTVRPNRLGESN